MNTNGDFLTEELAQSLDGVLDRILVSLYMDEPKKSERAKWLKTLFHTTDAIPLTMSKHIATHFSPSFNVTELAKQHINNVCTESQIRVVINHRQQFLLCCDDVVGNFDLGTFPETSLWGYWYGKKRIGLEENLLRGNRAYHAYCTTCPRG